MIPPTRTPPRPATGSGPQPTVTRDGFGWWRWEVLAADGTVRKSWTDGAAAASDIASSLKAAAGGIGHGEGRP